MGCQDVAPPSKRRWPQVLAYEVDGSELWGWIRSPVGFHRSGQEETANAVASQVLPFFLLSSTFNSSSKPGEEEPPADQPSGSSDLRPGSTRSSSGRAAARGHQLLLQPEGRHLEHGGDGGDLWSLEKRVEQLELQVLRLEEHHYNPPPGPEEGSLQEEVIRLRRGLEEHLGVFKNVFSNAHVLVGSDDTLDLHKLWQLVKNQDGRKKRRGGAGNHQSRRDPSGGPVQSDVSLLLEARSPLTVTDGVVLLGASTDPGHAYSHTGTFTAPATGVYLFVLTLDLRPGPAHMLLRGWDGALLPLHEQVVMEAGPVTGIGLLPLSKGAEVRLELKGEARGESQDNVFTVLLLHWTT